MKDDTIEFLLSAEETVVNDTVKIIATIAAMISIDSTEKQLRESMMLMMQSFISGQNWQFSGLSRRRHKSGLEELSVLSTARVPEAENYRLDHRAQEASSQGMRISDVSTDSSFPFSLVEITEQKLRLEILRKANEQCSLMKEATQRPYRVKRINFYQADGTIGNLSNNMRGTASASKQSYGSGFAALDVSGSSESPAISNAQKFTMTALITLGITV